MYADDVYTYASDNYYNTVLDSVLVSNVHVVPAEADFLPKLTIGIDTARSPSDSDFEFQPSWLKPHTSLSSHNITEVTCVGNTAETAESDSLILDDKCVEHDSDLITTESSITINEHLSNSVDTVVSVVTAMSMSSTECSESVKLAYVIEPETSTKVNTIRSSESTSCNNSAKYDNFEQATDVFKNFTFSDMLEYPEVLEPVNFAADIPILHVFPF